MLRIAVISILILTLFQQTIPLFAQGFAVGHLSSTFTDSSRANRPVKAEIYYPATTAGENVPLAPGKFPVLVFGHGFVMTWTAYQNLWTALVPEGYVMVFSDTETGFSPDHGTFGQDLAFLADQMQAENGHAISPFFTHLTDSTAVMGHSMGGGAAFLAVQHSAHIRALATLAPAETNPSAVSAAAAIQLPALVFAGGNDCVTPPAQHTVPMYNGLNSSCKSSVSIKGGGHCYFAEYNFNCNFGELTCSPQPTITRADQHLVVEKYLIPWLDFYLKGSCSAGNDFQAKVGTETVHTILQNCTLGCTNPVAGELQGNSLIWLQNPAEGRLVFRGVSHGRVNGRLIISDLAGREIWHTNFNLSDGTEVKLPSEIQDGMYVALLETENGTFSQKVLVKRR
ncbi:MAG: alpha/beta hydrolase [Bacteroidia bacterium]|nr:alpha/beta hydrolase [Bacteroidia bacterium]